MCFVNVPGLLSIQVAQAAEKTRRVLKNAMAQNSLWATDCRECLPLLHELPELHVRLLGRARVEPESSAVGEHSFLLLQEFVVVHLRDGIDRFRERTWARDEFPGPFAQHDAFGRAVSAALARRRTHRRHDHAGGRR